MRRRSAILIAVALTMVGCATVAPATPGATPSGAPPSMAPSATAVATGYPVGGGCGTTQFFSGQGPDSALGLAGNPWARARPEAAGFVAYAWTTPPDLVVASGPQDQGTKILWVNTVAPRGHLAIAAHRSDATSPAVVFDIPPASAPDGNYPSLIDLPTPGCWRLELTLGAAHATIDLQVAPAPSSPAPPAP